MMRAKAGECVRKRAVGQDGLDGREGQEGQEGRKGRATQPVYFDLELWRFDHIWESRTNKPVKKSAAEMVQSLGVAAGFVIGTQAKDMGANHAANLSALSTKLSSPIARTMASSSWSVMDRCEVDQCSTGCCGA
jgi:hypothetical protein